VEVQRDYNEIRTIGQFQEAILRQFKFDDESRLARDILAGLKQTGSVIQYTREFRAIILRISDISEAEARDKYVRGLKKEPRKEVLLRNPRTLDEVITIAERLDSLLNAIDRDVNNSSNAQDFGIIPSSDGQSQMDVDAIRFEETSDVNTVGFNRRRFQPLNDVSRRELSRIGACFYCRRTGHMRRDCPARARAGSGTTSSTNGSGNGQGRQ
jgi:hypothetical protein